MNYLEVFNRTIVALVTAPVNQNIALIRMSGSKTYEIMSQIFSRNIANDKKEKSKIILGKIVKNNQVIDEVLLSCFYSPYSFTGEDVVEISCHGNLIIVNQIIELLMSKGAQHATPGEFSKKAYFNNKLSLVQATAINDLIKATSSSAVKIALENFDPQRQQELEKLTDEILTIIAKVEINIDYPEHEDIEKITINGLKKSIVYLISEFDYLSKNCKKGKMMKDGLRVGIFGKPNVGKSTLLNKLVREEKAIVTPIAGTTRDVIEANYEIAGLPIRFFDTAGVRRTKNLIERKGIEKTRELLGKLDVSLLVTDSSREWSKEDEELFVLVKEKKHLLVVNKNDLVRKISFPVYVEEKNIVFISAELGLIEGLESRIIRDFLEENSGENSRYPFFTSQWQQSRISAIREKLEEILSALNEEVPVDILAGDLQIVFRLLRELSGKDYNEDLLEIIFSKFCLGK